MDRTDPARVGSRWDRTARDLVVDPTSSGRAGSGRAVDRTSWGLAAEWGDWNPTAALTTGRAGLGAAHLRTGEQAVPGATAHRTAPDLSALSRTESGQAGQDRAGQDRAVPGGTARAEPAQGRTAPTEPARAEPARAGAARAGAARVWAARVWIGWGGFARWGCVRGLGGGGRPSLGRTSCWRGVRPATRRGPGTRAWRPCCRSTTCATGHPRQAAPADRPAGRRQPVRAPGVDSSCPTSILLTTLLGEAVTVVHPALFGVPTPRPVVKSPRTDAGPRTYFA